jgi:hypothetical protein
LRRQEHHLNAVPVLGKILKKLYKLLIYCTALEGAQKHYLSIHTN